MAQDLLSNILFSALDFGKGVFLVSLLVTVFVFCAWVAKQRLQKRFGLSWIKATSLVTLAMVFCLVCVVFFLPLIGTSPGYEIPQELQEPLPNQIGFFFFEIFRLFFSSVVISFLLLPLVLIGSFVFDYLAAKTKLAFIFRLYLSVLCTTAIASYFLIFLAPFVLPGVFYLVFVGFGA